MALPCGSDINLFALTKDTAHRIGDVTIRCRRTR
jgi:hypothetical protein